MPAKFKKTIVSALLIISMFGILFWGGFQAVAEQTNSLEFCISCHAMEQTVYQEYINSPHYKNASGVRAICSDCHVPKQWLPKMLRKLQATNDIYHTIIGSINTAEKFEHKRLELAERVWERMKKTNSRECRSCHSFAAMDFHKQQRRSAEKMQKSIARNNGETCIDCHKGIAHQLPDGYGDDD